MTIFDYLLNAGLISLVVVQMRGRRLDRRGLMLPLILVAWAGSQYLHGVPTEGNDLVLVTAGIGLGTTLGTASAYLTKLHLGSDGVAIARATGWAAALWVVGIGARVGFALYTEHGGAPSVGRFSIAHHLTGQGWVTGLVLMAFAEVVSRTLMLWIRARTAQSLPRLSFAG